MNQTESAKDTTYNGYANYETWTVCVEIENTQGMAEELEKVVNSIGNCGKAQDHYKADELRLYYSYRKNPLVDDNSVFSTLLFSALENVKWSEVLECIKGMINPE